jgi:hypothetical protein
VDNFFTGTRGNVEALRRNPRFELLRHDVTFPLYVEDMVNQFLAVKRIYHKEEGKQVFHIFISQIDD